MGFFDMFKTKTEKKRLEIPQAPGMIGSSLSRLPEFPTFKSDMDGFEKKSVKVQEKELKQRETLDLENPLFIELYVYKAMIDEVGQASVLLTEDDEISMRLQDYTTDLDKEYTKFQKELEDAQRRLIFCDKKLFR